MGFVVLIVRAQSSYGILLIDSDCISFIQVVGFAKIPFFCFVFTLHVVELMELVVVGGAFRGKRGLRYRFFGNGERGRGTLRVSLDKFANWVIYYFFVYFLFLS